MTESYCQRSSLEPFDDEQTLAWNDDGDVRMEAKVLAGSYLSFVASAAVVDNVDHLL